MEDNNIGYYAIIPACVRYDSNLTPNAKLLYGEITALCNKNGICWATNEYFANLYNTSDRTITRWIKDLEKKDYISTKVTTKRYEDGTVKKIRTISLDKNVLNHIDNNGQYHTDNFVLNHTDKNVGYNNTYMNNTYMNNKEKEINKFISKKKVADKNIIPPTVEMVSEYCKERGNGISGQKFCDFYTSKGWLIGKTKMKDWQAAVRTWESKRGFKYKPKPIPETLEEDIDEELSDEEWLAMMKASDENNA